MNTAPAARRRSLMTHFGGSGCRYLVDDQCHQCGAKRQRGSSYCPEHHALCYLPVMSAAERRRLKQIDKIGAAVGGRLAAGAIQQLMLKVARIEGNA
jgi:hypothetical protein